MISFITPTYNHEKYIEKCIESVLSQDFKDVEQIIVDDGSTDRTGEIARGYESERIHYYRQENKGIRRLAETYNFAVSRTHGDIVVILEGDDYATNIRASRHYTAFLDKEVVVSWGITKRLDGDVFLGYSPEDPGKFLRMSDKQFIVSMFKGCQISANTVAVRKTALQKIGGFRQGEYYVDYPTWLALLGEGKFHFTNEVLSIWGVHGDSYSSLLGSTARPDIDAIRAYRLSPPSVRSLISEKDLLNSWKKSLIKGKISQMSYCLKQRKIKTGIHKLTEAVEIAFEKRN